MSYGRSQMGSSSMGARGTSGSGYGGDSSWSSSAPHQDRGQGGESSYWGQAPSGGLPSGGRGRKIIHSSGSISNFRQARAKPYSSFSREYGGKDEPVEKQLEQHPAFNNDEPLFPSKATENPSNRSFGDVGGKSDSFTLPGLGGGIDHSEPTPLWKYNTDPNQQFGSSDGNHGRNDNRSFGATGSFTGGNTGFGNTSSDRSYESSDRSYGNAEANRSYGNPPLNQTRSILKSSRYVPEERNLPGNDLSNPSYSDRWENQKQIDPPIIQPKVNEWDSKQKDPITQNITATINKLWGKTPTNKNEPLVTPLAEPKEMPGVRATPVSGPQDIISQSFQQDKGNSGGFTKDYGHGMHVEPNRGWEQDSRRNDPLRTADNVYRGPDRFQKDGNNMTLDNRNTGPVDQWGKPSRAIIDFRGQPSQGNFPGNVQSGPIQPVGSFSNRDPLPIGGTNLTSNLTASFVDDNIRAINRVGQHNKSWGDTSFSENTNIERGKDITIVRSMDRSLDRSLDQGMHRNLDHSMDRSMNRSLDRGLDRSLDRSLDRGLDRSLDRGLDRSLDRSLDRGLDRSLDRSLDRGLDRSLDPGMDRSLDRSTDRSKERSMDRNKDRNTDRGMERAKGSSSMDRSRNQYQKSSTNTDFSRHGGSFKSQSQHGKAFDQRKPQNLKEKGETPMNIETVNKQGYSSFLKPAEKGNSIPGLDATPVTFKCTMCAVSFPTKHAYELHCHSFLHTRNMALKNDSEKSNKSKAPKVEQKKVVNVPKPQDKEFHCEICPITFPLSRWKDHTLDNYHLKKVAQSVKKLGKEAFILKYPKLLTQGKLRDPNYCKVCSLHCFGKTLFFEHIKSAEHKSMLESSKKFLGDKVFNEKFPNPERPFNCFVGDEPKSVFDFISMSKASSDKGADNQNEKSDKGKPPTKSTSNKSASESSNSKQSSTSSDRTSSKSQQNRGKSDVQKITAENKTQIMAAFDHSTIAFVKAIEKIPADTVFICQICSLEWNKKDGVKVSAHFNHRSHTRAVATLKQHHGPEKFMQKVETPDHPLIRQGGKAKIAEDVKGEDLFISVHVLTANDRVIMKCIICGVKQNVDKFKEHLDSKVHCDVVSAMVRTMGKQQCTRAFGHTIHSMPDEDAILQKIQQIKIQQNQGGRSQEAKLKEQKEREKQMREKEEFKKQQAIKEQQIKEKQKLLNQKKQELAREQQEQEKLKQMPPGVKHKFGYQKSSSGDPLVVEYGVPAEAKTQKTPPSKQESKPPGGILAQHGGGKIDPGRLDIMTKLLHTVGVKDEATLTTVLTTAVEKQVLQSKEVAPPVQDKPSIPPQTKNDSSQRPVPPRPEPGKDRDRESRGTRQSPGSSRYGSDRERSGSRSISRQRDQGRDNDGRKPAGLDEKLRRYKHDSHGGSHGKEARYKDNAGRRDDREGDRYRSEHRSDSRGREQDRRGEKRRYHEPDIHGKRGRGTEGQDRHDSWTGQTKEEVLELERQREAEEAERLYQKAMEEERRERPQDFRDDDRRDLRELINEQRGRRDEWGQGDQLHDNQRREGSRLDEGQVHGEWREGSAGRWKDQHPKRGEQEEEWMEYKGDSYKDDGMEELVVDDRRPEHGHRKVDNSGHRGALSIRVTRDDHREIHEGHREGKQDWGGDSRRPHDEQVRHHPEERSTGRDNIQQSDERRHERVDRYREDEAHRIGGERYHEDDRRRKADWQEDEWDRRRTDEARSWPQDRRESEERRRHQDEQREREWSRQDQHIEEQRRDDRMHEDRSGWEDRRHDDRYRDEHRSDRREQHPNEHRRDERRPDDRYSDNRRADDRLPDARYDDQRPGDRYVDDRRRDDRHPDDRHPDVRHPDDRHPDDRRPDGRHLDDRRPDDRRPDERHHSEPRYDDRDRMPLPERDINDPVPPSIDNERAMVDHIRATSGITDTNLIMESIRMVRQLSPEDMVSLAQLGQAVEGFGPGAEAYESIMQQLPAPIVRALQQGDMSTQVLQTLTTGMSPGARGGGFRGRGRGGRGNRGRGFPRGRGRGNPNLKKLT